MCERISVVGTTTGKSIKYYAAPGLDSHGEARAGWRLGSADSGAEIEWTGEAPESLTVRHETDAKLVKQMILDKYKTRSEFMAAEIFETRDENGLVMWYPRNQAELCEILKNHELPSIGLANYQEDCIDLVSCQDLDARDYRGEITNLVEIKGNAYLRGFTGTLPALATIGGYADLRGFTGTLPALATIGGYAYLSYSSCALPVLATIGGYADLRGFTGTLPQLATIGGNAYLDGFTGTLPVLATIGGNAYLDGFTGTLPALATIGWSAYLSGFTGTLPNDCKIKGPIYRY